MKYLIVLTLIFASCSETNSEEEFINPDNYLEVSENESQVNSFELRISGSNTINYDLYEAELIDDVNASNREVKGDLIESKSISFSNDTIIKFNSGFNFIDISFENKDASGEYSVYLNSTHRFKSGLLFDSYNNSETKTLDLLIPYKYSE